MINLASLTLLVGCEPETHDSNGRTNESQAADTAAADSGGPNDTGGETGETGATHTGDIEQRAQTDQPVYDVGERVVVEFIGAGGTATDWIGLYPADQADNEGSTAWVYTSGSQTPADNAIFAGEVRFLPINLPAGEWEARLLHNDGYELHASVSFTVVDPGQMTAPTPIGDLTVMTFNVWVNGTGVAQGVEKIAAAVVACDPDFVAFQEANRQFGNDVRDALATLDSGWVDADIATDEVDNTIVSRLPILKYEGASGGYFVRATMQLEAGQEIEVVGSHFDYTQYGPWLARDGESATAIEATEARVRGDDATAVVEALDDGSSTLVLGDHNAPSHLDWTVENADQNFDLTVEWPTSVALADAGFIDGYRTVWPDPAADRGLTWSPGYPKGELDADDVHDRIDFVYHRDGVVEFTPVQAYTYAADPWPSDHRAVVVSYEVR